jgi:carboxymethylenebutenolidase
MNGFELLEYKPGSRARLYLAGVETGCPGVVVLHPWWGLNEDVIAYADRLAGAGFAVVAPDLYDGAVETTIEGAESRSDSLDQATTGAITLAAVDFLGERLGPGAQLATLGFSMGAAWALWAPAKRTSLAATAVYYGSMTGPSIAAGRVPVLGHFAESDPYETDEGVAAFEKALLDAGRRATIHRYPGTGHWFAEPSRKDAYAAGAAELAFERTVAFLREQSSVGSVGSVGPQG